LGKGGGSFSFAGIDVVPSSRTVSVMYRDTLISGVPVASITAEIHLRVWAAMKGGLIHQKLLSPLACEEVLDISTHEDDSKIWKCDKEVAAAVLWQKSTTTTTKHIVVSFLCVC